jgi:hypothetical protein
VSIEEAPALIQEENKKPENVVIEHKIDSEFNSNYWKSGNDAPLSKELIEDF